MYQALKHLHMTCVILSLGGFLLRSWWMCRGNALLSTRLVRTVPHVVDTVLLATGITLAVMIEQYPLQASWVTAKVAGLLGYIVLGTIALKRGRTMRIRLSAFAAAVVVFSWIVSVAFSKNPAGWFAAVV